MICTTRTYCTEYDTRERESAGGLFIQLAHTGNFFCQLRDLSVSYHNQQENPDTATLRHGPNETDIIISK